MKVYLTKTQRSGSEKVILLSNNINDWVSNIIEADNYEVDNIKDYKTLLNLEYEPTRYEVIITLPRGDITYKICEFDI